MNHKYIHYNTTVYLGVIQDKNLKYSGKHLSTFLTTLVSLRTVLHPTHYEQDKPPGHVLLNAITNEGSHLHRT